MLVLVLDLCLDVDKLREPEILHRHEENIVVVVAPIGKLLQVVVLPLVVLLIIKERTEVPFVPLIVIACYSVGHNVFKVSSPTFTNHRSMGDDEGALYIHLPCKLQGTQGLAEAHLGIPQILSIFRLYSPLIAGSLTATTLAELGFGIVDGFPLFHSERYPPVVGS